MAQKVFRLYGIMHTPCTVLVVAENAHQATIRALYSEYENVEKRSTSASKFMLSADMDAEEVPGLLRNHRYRVIWRETTMYGVECLSNRTLQDLVETGEWRDEVDRYNTSHLICWQAENAMDVSDEHLIHIEEMPIEAMFKKKGKQK